MDAATVPRLQRVPKPSRLYGFREGRTLVLAANILKPFPNGIKEIPYMKTPAIFAALALAVSFVPSVVRAADVSSEFVPTLPSAHASVDASARKAWKLSLLPLVASETLDAASSYGMRELNPVLAGSNGEFGMRATTIKFGVIGVFIGVEYLIVKAHPGAARIFSKVNWAAAGVTTGLAVHNYAVAH
jgi:hypothetical protein